MQNIDKKLSILDAAQQLFNKKGYQKTTVREITELAGIAKGTFYLYFQSKEDVLLKIIEQDIEETVQDLQAIVDQPSVPAMEKFKSVYRYMFDWSAEQNESKEEYLKALYRTDNILYRIRITTRFKRYVSSILNAIILQGISENSFDVTQPQETSEIIIGMKMNLQEMIAQNLLKDQNKSDWIDQLTNMVSAFESAIEKILGLQKNALSFRNTVL